MVSRDGNNPAIIAENLSFEEEEFDEVEIVYLGKWHNHDYRMKADIPLFYITIGMEGFLDSQINVDRFFDVGSKCCQQFW